MSEETPNHARNDARNDARNADARHEHMHKTLEADGEAMIATAVAQPPFGAGFEFDEIKDAVRLEVWSTTFRHPSDTDFNLFELYDKDGNLIASKKLEGY